MNDQQLAALEKRVRALEDERRDYWTAGKYLRDERFPFVSGDFNKAGGTTELTIRRISDLEGKIKTLANGDNDDIVISGDDGEAISVISITGPTGAFAVTGFQTTAWVQNARPRHLLFLLNTTAQEMTIKNADIGSTAGNRILTLTGADVVLRTGLSSAIFLYVKGSLTSWVLWSYNG